MSLLDTLWAFTRGPLSSHTTIGGVEWSHDVGHNKDMQMIWNLTLLGRVV